MRTTNRSIRTRTTCARALAGLLAVTMASPLWAAPGDITQVPAPMLGSDAPKAKDIPDGDASVSTQTGALQYSYPIEVPPGRLGMAPQLALSYSSQGATYGGVASGWSLSIPEIRLDTSESVLKQKYFAGLDTDPWFRERYISTLSGSRPLVPVTESFPLESTVYQAFRAQNDSGWIRYERMKPGQTYKWRARTPDGITHYFGDSNLGAWSSNVVPLTRSVDSFGNTIEYQWSGYQISQIRYTSNAGLPAFARVEFDYAPLEFCHARLPIGAQEDRRLDWLDGEKRLTKIRAVAFNPANGTVEHTREYTLGYDSAAMSCTANHAPVRLLTSIQQSAWGPLTPLVSLPPVTFAYNRLERTFDQIDTVTESPWNDWPTTDTMSVSTGTRSPNGWPVIQEMMLDFDGDGLVDRIQLIDDPNECKFQWQKNLGRNSSGTINFDWGIEQTMPRLPWKNGQREPDEKCTLNYQFTKRGNIPHPPQWPCEENNGTYLAYRWMDITGDGLVDLVAAVHHDYHYNPDIDVDPAFFSQLHIAGWPACPPPDDGACPVPSSTCMHAALECDGEEPCRFGEPALAACMAASPRVTCDRLMRGMDQYGPNDPDQNQLGPDWPDGATPPSADCQLKKEHERCERFPWFIYENTGGAFEAEGGVKYQPVPLESDGGDSSIGGGGGSYSSTAHALQDMDGDGFIDLVTRGKYSEIETTDPPIWWFVWRGDGTGGFLSHETGDPYVWFVPEDAHINGTCPSETGTLCVTPPPGTVNTTVPGYASLIELNGDGAVDFAWTIGNAGAFQAQGFWGDGQSFASFGSGPNGHLLGSNVDMLSRSWVHGNSFVPFGPYANWLITGWRQGHNQTIDVDDDGRVDLVTSELTGYDTAPWPTKLRYNDGGTFLTPRDLNQLPNLQSGLMQRTEATGFLGDDHWSVKWDLIDMDGDGLPEQWKFPIQAGQNISVRRDLDTQPLRLLKQVDNGRGGKVDVVYASTNDTATVTQNAASGKALPRTQWVVKSLSVRDLWDQLDVSTTTYQYVSPVWKADERGKKGFRGFEEVITFAPSLAATIDRYDYTTDWSGRLTSTRRYESSDYANPRTIAETVWESRSLFGGVITTYHSTRDRKWTCANGQNETACRSTNAARVETFSTLQQLPPTGTAQMYFAADTYTTNSGTYAVGDRKRIETRALFVDADDYRVQTLEVIEKQKTSEFPSLETTFSRVVNTFDSTYRVHETSDVFFTLTVDPDGHHHAITRSTYDMTTGVRLTTRSPRNYPSGPVESYVYDAAKRFVTTTTNEVGHVVERKYESGTGMLLNESGPNSSSCGTNCTNWEQTWTDVDGLGRPTATWVNRAVPGNAVWQKTQVGRFKYTDSVINGARTKVESDSLIDYEPTPRWTHEVTELDGRGRPDILTVTTGGAANAVTSYDYDHRGLLVAVTLPDPSQTNASTVTYTYGYDSIGRPTSMRRPAIGGPNASGIDLSYNGLVHSRSEVAGSQGGPAARTDLVHDAFGRLVEVREFTSPTAHASTTYQYDANDNVRWISNPDGIVTELLHDFESRRTSIVRWGRTWSYAYFPGGELKWEKSPPPSTNQQPQYTNFYAYDALGRETSRALGSRGASMADLDYFGARQISFGYTGCVNGVGRLCSATHNNGVLSTTYQYDAEGNSTQESRTFSFGGVTGTRVSSSTYGPGGRVVSQTFADNTTGQNNASVALFEYDSRALPNAVKWKTSAGVTKTVARQARNTAGLVTVRYTDFQTTGWNESDSTWTYDPLTRVKSQRVVQGQNGLAVEFAKQELDYFGNDDPQRLRHWLRRSPTSTGYYDMTFGFDQRHQLTSVSEGANRFNASYQFSNSGILKRTTVCNPCSPGPGAEVLARDVWHMYDTMVGAEPEAAYGLKNVSNGSYLRYYNYDTVGNMSSRFGPGAPSDTFAYDGEDQLRRSTVTSGGVTTKEEYFYDHRGNRAAIVTRNSQGAVTTVRVFQGDSELVFTSTGTLSKALAHLSLGTPVARITNRTDLELQYNGLSNNTLLSVQPNGATKSGFVYAPYGELLETTGTSLPDQHRRFNDKYRDDLTKLAYYGVRYYDNVLLSWTQADPLYRFLPDAAWDSPRFGNLYQFSLNNPLSYLDPDGRSPYGGPPGTNVAQSTIANSSSASSTAITFVERKAAEGVKAWVNSNPMHKLSVNAVKEGVAWATGEQSGTDAIRHVVSDSVRTAGETRGPLGSLVANAVGDLIDNRDDGQQVDLLTAKPTPGADGKTSTSPTAGKKVDSKTRERILARDQKADGSWDCATCGQNTKNPDNIHTGHIIPRSQGGDLSDGNLRCEGAACNLSQGDRAAPKPGGTCKERGSCGAPYGRKD